VKVIERLWIGTCSGARDRMSEHLEGELRGFRERRFLRHLRSCDRCRAVLLSLRRAVEQLRALGRAETPSVASVADAVVNRIRPETPGEIA
jgi:predicted anti-sigma-YlaC factor YlaD